MICSAVFVANVACPVNDNTPEAFRTGECEIDALGTVPLIRRTKVWRDRPVLPKIADVGGGAAAGGGTSNFAINTLAAEGHNHNPKWLGCDVPSEDCIEASQQNGEDEARAAI